MHITLICADDDIWAAGMRSISSALRSAGHETRMIFAGSLKVSLDRPTINRVASLARESDIIGISSMSRASERAKTLIAGLKPLRKLIVWGGMHPTIFPEDCAPHADLVCRGEGEEFMLDLVERLAAGRGFADIPNGACWKAGQLQLNDVRMPVPDLDRLPFPDFSFEKEYILDGTGCLQPNARMREASLVSFSGSRGCVNNCHYCSNSQLKSLYKGKGRFARKMSVTAFIEAARECRRLFPRAKYIYFTDEDFFARPVEEIREFAEAYPARGGLPFECMASPRQITEEKMELLAKAGMWRIDVGVESGSDETKRHVFNRTGDNETVARAAAAIRKHPRVVAWYFFIIGNPYEKRRDLLDTIGLLRRLPPPFFMRAYNLIFIPGTQLFRRACQDGIISGIEDSGHELDFGAGFDHRSHAWKKHNVYLNSLISLMFGKSTPFRIGALPRTLIPALTAQPVVAFCDRHAWIGEMLVDLAKTSLVMRRAAIKVISNVLKDRRIAYDLKFLLRRGGAAHL